MPERETGRHFDEERHELAMRILQKIDRLLDDFSARPDHFEPIKAQISALSRVLQELTQEEEPPQ
jgi:hypothetical protein